MEFKLLRNHMSNEDKLARGFSKQISHIISIEAYINGDKYSHGAMLFKSGIDNLRDKVNFMIDNIIEKINEVKA